MRKSSSLAAGSDGVKAQASSPPLSWWSPASSHPALSNNMQVAEWLTVSRKAVEFHLTSIYAILGVSSRSYLAANLDSLGTPGAASLRNT
jgi:hypothetical protein